ncbi:MAG: YjbE family putative metal transport protein, partial [Alphaproteobacteria bacterium]
MDFSSILDNFNLATFGKIMFANTVLSGDNAVLIGLAAAGLPAAQRSRAILFGMIFATVLRVIFSIFAVYLLEVPGLLLIGGLLLLWIAYGFFKELHEEKAEEDDPEGHEDGAGGKTMAQALKQIVIADVSMSLDNVLAIAGIARGN